MGDQRLDDLLWAHLSFKRKLRAELLGDGGPPDLQSLVELALVVAEAASYVLADRERVRGVLARVRELAYSAGEDVDDELIRLSRALTRVVSEAVEEAMGASRGP
ncbi:MAG: hypothetical protein DRO01_01740 [Thermoproteota archaeon]|nr:MAG: hypothetical protein DRO01_01740 [Candidatus Korarchaeota archaeon]